MSVRNKKAIITGATRGIGAAIANRLADEGARLFLTGRDEKSLKKMKTELSKKGAAVDCLPADLTDVAQVEKVLISAMEFLGEIDILINNAGMGIKGNITDMNIEDWDHMFDLNLKAVFLLSRRVGQKMISQKSGYIISIGSGASQTPIAGFAAYCATKYGLLGFSESLALELRQYNIKVSIILPGSTATNFGGSNPQEQISAKPGILRSEDVADSVMYLLNQSKVAWTSVMNLRPLNPNRG